MRRRPQAGFLTRILPGAPSHSLGRTVDYASRISEKSFKFKVASFKGTSHLQLATSNSLVDQMLTAARPSRILTAFPFRYLQAGAWGPAAELFRMSQVPRSSVADCRARPASPAMTYHAGSCHCEELQRRSNLLALVSRLAKCDTVQVAKELTRGYYGAASRTSRGKISHLPGMSGAILPIPCTARGCSFSVPGDDLSTVSLVGVFEI